MDNHPLLLLHSMVDKEREDYYLLNLLMEDLIVPLKHLQVNEEVSIILKGIRRIPEDILKVLDILRDMNRIRNILKII